MRGNVNKVTDMEAKVEYTNMLLVRSNVNTSQPRISISKLISEVRPSLTLFLSTSSQMAESFHSRASSINNSEWG